MSDDEDVDAVPGNYKGATRMVFNYNDKNNKEDMGTKFMSRVKNTKQTSSNEEESTSLARPGDDGILMVKYLKNNPMTNIKELKRTVSTIEPKKKNQLYNLKRQEDYLERLEALIDQF